MNCCCVPVPSPVKPSPIKKVWASAGESVVKFVPMTVKSKIDGEGSNGSVEVKKTPTKITGMRRMNTRYSSDGTSIAVGRRGADAVGIISVTARTDVYRYRTGDRGKGENGLT